MKIAMIGAGYVGLVTSACLADFGHDVVCVDVDEGRVAELKAGRVPIYEPGLDALMAVNTAAGRLSFVSNLAAAVGVADAVFIAVGTPSRRGDGHADLSYVYEASAQIAAALKGFTVVITKSTVPVGTGDEIDRIIRSANPSADFAVVSNPEFLREGAAIRDFKLPDRIVVGTEDPRAVSVMSAIYRPLHVNKGPLMFTGRRTAELIKYAANAFLATKVSFINEVADLCEAVGADVQEVARGIGADGRIGSKFLHAGPGYGGSCFPKDTVALVRTAHDHQVPMRIVEAVGLVNEQRKRAMGLRVVTALGGSARGKRVALLGLAFKSNTDDMREAPSLAIVGALKDAGADIVAHDPAAISQARLVLNDTVAYSTDPYGCAEGADALVVVTEWDAFRGLDLDRLKASMRGDVLVDLRNIYKPEDAMAAGFNYFGVGVGTGKGASAPQPPS